MKSPLHEHPPLQTDWLWLMMPEWKQSFQSHGIVQHATCHAYFLLSTVMARQQTRFTSHFYQLKPSKVLIATSEGLRIEAVVYCTDCKALRQICDIGLLKIDLTWMWCIFLWRCLPEEGQANPKPKLGLALKPLSPCTLVDVPVGCLLACWGRHPRYNAVISLPSHQHLVCWVNPSSLLLSPPPLSHQTHSLPFHVSCQGSWAPQWCIPVPRHSGQGWHPPYISL